MHRFSILPSIVIALVAALTCVAKADLPATAPAATNPAEVTVAILDFDSSAPGAPQLGSQINDVLSAILSGEPDVALVDRTTLNKVLSEHALNLSGLVNTDDAVKIGKLVGAKILVTGKVFTLDKEIFLTAKLIGTETSLVQGVLVRGDKNTDVAPLILSLSDKVATKLRDTGGKLVAAPDKVADPLPGLKDQLAKLQLPKVAIHVEEKHISEAVPARIDPAVETELRQMLTQCGMTVIDGDERQQAQAGVTVRITGEAFSEYAARIGNIVSCVGRVEIKIVDVRTGQVLLSDRETARGVDLAENIAGKNALQKAGHTVGVRILRHFAQTLPPVK